MSQKLLFIELNEVNFDFVRSYIRSGQLPAFRRLIEAHGITETSSEERFEEWEPWIQWVTCHTGLSLAEHGVFRLGDIMKHDIPQIWEELEKRGLRVGAVSPMNAKNRTQNAAFFMPDPWTDTAVTGPLLLHKVYKTIVQAVNDNAQARITPISAFWLACGLLAYAAPSNYARYLKLIFQIRANLWNRALLLDLLLGDIFIHYTRRTQPHFASLFLNAAAHIQHHYMFSSSAYSGPLKNPEWYVASKADPLLEIYRLYDRILSHIQRQLPEYRLMLATGLHQDPHPEVTFFWRLKDHNGFLAKIGAPHVSTNPLMARDFVVNCANETDAAQTTSLLEKATASDGTRLFDVDNRGSDVFVVLSYPRDIGPELSFRIGNVNYEGLREHVAFVAIKNGEHNGTGYFIDTGKSATVATSRFPLKAIPAQIKQAVLQS